MSSPVLRLDGRPEPLREWFRSLWSYRKVLSRLARKDFRVRYKGASFGIGWAIVMPVLQAAVMAMVFSRIARFGDQGYSYAVYVLTGLGAWIYATTSIQTATTAIVDGAALTDKVWFPRAILALVPPAANLVTLAISVVVILVALPVLGEPYTLRLLLLVPGAALLVAFTTAFGMVLSALYVYFRDVRFMVQALLLVWFYLTPVLYPLTILGSTARWLAYNPMTGIIEIFHRATVDTAGPTTRALVVSVAATVVLAVAGVVALWRHDRLFVDQL